MALANVTCSPVPSQLDKLKTYFWSSSESPWDCSGFSAGTSSDSDLTFVPLFLFFRMPFIGRGAAIPTRVDCQTGWLECFSSIDFVLLLFLLLSIQRRDLFQTQSLS